MSGTSGVGGGRGTKTLARRGAQFCFALTIVAAAISGCQSANPGSGQASKQGVADVGVLSGEWSMDLSPAQDGSYLKSLVITPDEAAPGKVVSTFTGAVYGGSPFDNGQVLQIDGGVAFAFVSDEKGEMGGPYYWLGQKVTRPANSSGAEVLTGRVRSLSRKFEMAWSARRSVPVESITDQSQPDAKSATKSK